MHSGEAGEERWDGSDPLDSAAKPPLDAGEGHFPHPGVVIFLAKHEGKVCRGIPVCQVISKAKAR